MICKIRGSKNKIQLIITVYENSRKKYFGKGFISICGKVIAINAKLRITNAIDKIVFLRIYFFISKIYH